MSTFAPIEDVGPEAKFTLRAGPDTPANLRHLDSRTFRIPLGVQSIPEPGFCGELFGYTGVMRPGLVWELTTPRPFGGDLLAASTPTWATVLLERLDEIKALLQPSATRRDGGCVTGQ